MNPALETLFPLSSPITPAAPESLRADFPKIPAKPAVYLLSTATGSNDNHPVLLATVGDLRAALKRRLADSPPDAKTKRVPYGTLCTRVHFRIVHSALAANFYYAQAAHRLFPQTAPALIPWHTSWWLAVERPGPASNPFPRFRKISTLTDPSLAYAGPIRDKHAAQRLVECLEDLFDLCRYHHILIQAPRGKACAYKEMGKCPAPCDGTVSLHSYREQINAALAFLTNTQSHQAPGSGGGVTSSPLLCVQSPRAAWRQQLEQQMQSAAAALHFETAAKIKQRLARAALLDTGPFASIGRLEDFAFLTLQPGKGRPWIEPWLIHFGESESGAIENPLRPLPQFNKQQLPAAAEQLAGQCRDLLQNTVTACLTADQTRHAALVAYHLFKGDADHGVWLRLAAAREPTAISQAAENLYARKAHKPLAEQSTDATPESGDSGEPAVAGDV